MAASPRTILVDIGHPGHVHLFRNPIHRWKQNGHKVVVAIRDRPMVSLLLDSFGIEHHVVSKVKTSFLGLVYELLEHDVGVIRLAVRTQADVLIGTSVCITHAGLVLRKPSIVFNEDDKIYLHAWAWLAYPFATRIVVPFVLSDRKTDKYISHQSLHEFSYLHPDQFQPDPGVLVELGVRPGERFFIVRFVALQAHHDFRHRGLDLSQRQRLLAALEQHGRVFVSDEGLPADDQSRWRLPIPASRIHHAMFFASMLIGDSQTMAVEAAVLGTPAIRCNTFVRHCSIINELGDRYGLIQSYHPSDFETLLVDVLGMLQQKNMDQRHLAGREQLLLDKQNFSELTEHLVIDFLDSRGRATEQRHGLPRGVSDVDLALKLFNWMVARDFRGIDPYLLDAKLNLVGVGSFLRPLMRRVRAVLKPLHSLIPPQVFSAAAPVFMPKVAGLSLAGLAGLAPRLVSGAYRADIESLVERLLATRSRKARNLCWGHPFTWGATIRFEADTPSIPVTAIIGHGLLDVQTRLRLPDLDAHLESVACYILDENGRKAFDDSVCFYYAPDNADLTYNTSIIAATYLLRLGRHLGVDTYDAIAFQALRFVLQGQNADGSWYYTDPRGDTALDKTIDGRHTGFILEHLVVALNCIKLDSPLAAPLRQGLTRGTDFYLNMLMDGCVPRWEPGGTYPVDVKDVAQAIITLSAVGHLALARQCLDFAYEHFFDGTDAFWYKLHKNGLVNKTVFVRWSQAWMFKAIGCLVSAEARK